MDAPPSNPPGRPPQPPTDLLQTIVECIPVRAFWKDRDSRYLGCNTAFARDAGVASPAEVIGRTDHDLGWKDQAERYRADDRAVMESGVPRLGYEEPQTTPDGRTVWLRTSKVPLRDAAGAVIGVLGIYDDITTQRAAQEALRVNQFAIDRAHDGICRVDAAGRFEYVNQAFCDLLGYRADELLQLRPWDVAEGVMQTSFPERWRQEIAAAGELREAQLRHRDGHLVPVDLSVNPVRYQGRELVISFVRDLTGRKAIEAQARQSDNRFRALVEQSPLAMQIVAPDGVTLQVNRAWERLWDVTADAAVGTSLLADPRLLAPGHLPEVIRAFGGQPVVLPGAAYEGPDAGAPRWVRPVLYPVRTEDGVVCEVVVMYQDLTDQRQAEQALRESEQRFRDLFEASPDPCWIINQENLFTLCNRAAADRLGYERIDDLRSTHPAELSPPTQAGGRDSRTAADDMMAQAHARGVHRFEWIHRDRHGQTFPVEVTLARIELGGRPQLYCVWRDISERKAQDQALLETRRLHEEAQRIAHLGHWQLDHPSGVLRWSDETFRIFGLDPERHPVSYAAFIAAVHPDDRDRVEAAFAHAVATRTAYHIDHRLIAPDGKLRWVNERCETTYDDAGPLVSTGTATDITDRRLAEDEQAVLRAQLAATQRLESRSPTTSTTCWR
jgi:PAS domain S-box-containing protein